MCLAIPARVMKIKGNTAECDFGGVTRNVNIEMVEVEVNDYVIVHVGYAIEKMSEKEAKETIELWKHILEMEEEEWEEEE